MQKKLIALAVAGLASTAAFAQSNVTIYGVADATFDSIRTTGSGVEPRHNRVSTNSSYIGFKGTEALGNGLSAVFQYEIGTSFDGAGALSLSRDSYVGLSHNKFGTVLLGNLTGPTRAFGAAVDVFAGATGIGANSGIIGKFGGALQNATIDANGTLAIPLSSGRSATNTSTFDTRWKNAIAYVSPTIAGFTGIAAYVANENKDSSPAINTYGYDLGVKYENGPLMVGLSYNRADINNQAVNPVFGLSDISASDARLVGAYDFKVVRITGLYERTKVQGDNYSERQHVWGLGAQVPVFGNGKIVGQYYRAGDISGNGAADEGARLWAIGYEHSLSKRTILKATYANLKNEDDAYYQFGVNSNNANVGETGSGFQFGIRHSF